jgi:ethanolamine utilization cobalamin adenosyltransferase
VQAEVLDRPFTEEPLLGLNNEQLREESHNLVNFFPAKTMRLPSYQDGFWAIELNFLRTATRQCEVAAVTAYKSSHPVDHSLVTALNRLSSAFYVLAETPLTK